MRVRIVVSYFTQADKCSPYIELSFREYIREPDSYEAGVVFIVRISYVHERSVSKTILNLLFCKLWTKGFV